MGKSIVALALMTYATLSLADVSVKDAWVRGTAAGQAATGAFMTLTAGEDAVLLGVSSPVAGIVEVHETSMDNGIMKMRAVPRLDLPAGKPVALRPGGHHVMMMDLRRSLARGESVPLLLKIEGRDKKITTQEVTAEVRELTAPPAMDHRH